MEAPSSGTLKNISNLELCVYVNTFFVLNALSAYKKMMIYGEE